MVFVHQHHHVAATSMMLPATVLVVMVLQHAAAARLQRNWQPRLCACAVLKPGIIPIQTGFVHVASTCHTSVLAAVHQLNSVRMQAEPVCLRTFQTC